MDRTASFRRFWILIVLFSLLYFVTISNSTLPHGGSTSCFLTDSVGLGRVTYTVSADDPSGNQGSGINSLDFTFTLHRSQTGTLNENFEDGGYCHVQFRYLGEWITCGSRVDLNPYGIKLGNLQNPDETHTLTISSICPGGYDPFSSGNHEWRVRCNVLRSDGYVCEPSPIYSLPLNYMIDQTPVNINSEFIDPTPEENSVIDSDSATISVHSEIEGNVDEVAEIYINIEHVDENGNTLSYSDYTCMYCQDNEETGDTGMKSTSCSSDEICTHTFLLDGPGQYNIFAMTTSCGNKDECDGSGGDVVITRTFFVSTPSSSLCFDPADPNQALQCKEDVNPNYLFGPFKYRELNTLTVGRMDVEETEMENNRIITVTPKAFSFENPGYYPLKNASVVFIVEYKLKDENVQSGFEKRTLVCRANTFDQGFIKFNISKILNVSEVPESEYERTNAVVCFTDNTNDCAFKDCIMAYDLEPEVLSTISSEGYFAGIERCEEIDPDIILTPPQSECIGRHAYIEIKVKGANAPTSSQSSGNTNPGLYEQDEAVPIYYNVRGSSDDEVIIIEYPTVISISRYSIFSPISANEVSNTPYTVNLCLPVILLFALLFASMYATGNNPFFFFDLTRVGTARMLKVNYGGGGLLKTYTNTSKAKKVNAVSNIANKGVAKLVDKASGQLGKLADKAKGSGLAKSISRGMNKHVVTRYLLKGVNFAGKISERAAKRATSSIATTATTALIAKGFSRGGKVSLSDAKRTVAKVKKTYVKDSTTSALAISDAIISFFFSSAGQSLLEKIGVKSIIKKFFKLFASSTIDSAIKDADLNEVAHKLEAGELTYARVYSSAISGLVLALFHKSFEAKGAHTGYISAGAVSNWKSMFNTLANSYVGEIILRDAEDAADGLQKRGILAEFKFDPTNLESLKEAKLFNSRKIKELLDSGDYSIISDLSVISLAKAIAKDEVNQLLPLLKNLDFKTLHFLALNLLEYGRSSSIGTPSDVKRLSNLLFGDGSTKGLIDKFSAIPDSALEVYSPSLFRENYLARSSVSKLGELLLISSKMREEGKISKEEVLKKSLDAFDKLKEYSSSKLFGSGNLNRVSFLSLSSKDFRGISSLYHNTSQELQALVTLLLPSKTSSKLSDSEKSLLEVTSNKAKLELLSFLLSKGYLSIKKDKSGKIIGFELSKELATKDQNGDIILNIKKDELSKDAVSLLKSLAEDSASETISSSNLEFLNTSDLLKSHLVSFKSMALLKSLGLFDPSKSVKSQLKSSSFKSKVTQLLNSEEADYLPEETRDFLSKLVSENASERDSAIKLLSSSNKRYNMFLKKLSRSNPSLANIIASSTASDHIESFKDLQTSSALSLRQDELSNALILMKLTTWSEGIAFHLSQENKKPKEIKELSFKLNQLITNLKDMAVYHENMSLYNNMNMSDRDNFNMSYMKVYHMFKEEYVQSVRRLKNIGLDETYPEGKDLNKIFALNNKLNKVGVLIDRLGDSSLEEDERKKIWKKLSIIAMGEGVNLTSVASVVLGTAETESIDFSKFAGNKELLSGLKTELSFGIISSDYEKQTGEKLLSPEAVKNNYLILYSALGKDMAEEAIKYSLSESGASIDLGAAYIKSDFVDPIVGLEAEKPLPLIPFKTYSPTFSPSLLSANLLVVPSAEKKPEVEKVKVEVPKAIVSKTEAKGTHYDVASAYLLASTSAKKEKKLTTVSITDLDKVAQEKIKLGVTRLLNAPYIGALKQGNKGLEVLPGLKSSQTYQRAKEKINLKEGEAGYKGTTIGKQVFVSDDFINKNMFGKNGKTIKYNGKSVTIHNIDEAIEFASKLDMSKSSDRKALDTLFNLNKKEIKITYVPRVDKNTSGVLITIKSAASKKSTASSRKRRKK